MFVGRSFIVNQFDYLEADYFGYFVHNEVKDKNHRCIWLKPVLRLSWILYLYFNKCVLFERNV